MVQELIIGLVVVVVLTLLFRWVYKLKGKIGEKDVARILRRLPTDDYRVINDVILPTPYGSSQIDHVVVSQYGIFVIETKYYKGVIYGGEHSEYWTKNVYGKKYQFYNPVRQNSGHVTALRKNLSQYRGLPVFSIVAFSSQANLQVNLDNACVIYWRQIPSVIRQFDQIKMTTDDVDAIYNEIVSINAASKKKRRTHMKSVRAAKKRKATALSEGRCPRCGGELVLRSGKYGEFYGCSNYPSCKYTIEAD